MSDDRSAYVRGQMHREFKRDDFLGKLAAHAGIDEGDKATRDQWAAHDADRQARHEQRYDQSRIARAQGALYRLRDDRDAARHQHLREAAQRGWERGQER